jgi:hypothetical protein
VKAKKPLVILAILVAGLILFGLSDNVVSIADTDVPNNEITSSIANNSSAGATITITMTGILDE